jgi:hypothetical protein
MEYERMTYDAKELNDFSALTTQQAKKSFDDRAIKYEKKADIAPQPVHKKDFYEELYDKQHQ